MTPTKLKRLLIIDGANMFIRNYVMSPQLDSNGKPIGGLVGFMRSLQKEIRRTNPDRVAIAWEGPGGSQSRKDKNKNYKAGRKPPKLNREYEFASTEEETDNKYEQMLRLTEYLENLPVFQLMLENVEADDIIAWLCHCHEYSSWQKVIISSDKDFLQLVSDTTIVWSPTKKKIYNTESLKEEFGIESKNILLYRTLDGDDSDEIPGIKGLGIKTLLKRIPEFTGDVKLSMDDLFRLCEEKQVEKKPIKLYNDILSARPQLEMNERLMQLYDPEISGTIKMNILSQYDEHINPLNKLDFMKVCMKYKIIDTFGNMSDWLNQTFGTMITDR
mgnify:CR=1 FL=1